MEREPAVTWSAFQRRCAAVVAASVAALVVASAALVWAASQDAPTGRRWWVVAGAALLIGFGASLPLLREVGSTDYVLSCLALAILLVLALAAVFSAAQAAHGIGIHGHAPPSAAATVTDCHRTGRQMDEQAPGDPTYGCTYHWSVDGRPFSEERPTDEPYPDGHRTTVWLDNGRMITARPSLLAIPFWILCALAASAATLAFTATLAWKTDQAGLLHRPTR
ncbi:hypothetical protein [Kitasatospora cinereorecta]|uniref:DUF3592 domain-containing protein n=1 Tax=Kitasatospora cinereorecta TaxID=285560 RepID=A0ABW0VER3_9ACTN